MPTAAPASHHFVSGLRSQYPANLIGVSGEPVRLSWQIKAGVSGADQNAYRIQVSLDPQFASILGDSGVQLGAQQLAIEAPGGSLPSREIRYFRVQVEVAGKWSDWSMPVSVEAGLLNACDWSATFIGDNSKLGEPSPLLRKEISLRAKPAKARLRVSSMGLNDFFINGLPVTDSFLNPGWTVYQHRLLSETHDVTDLLTSGENTLAAELSDGWWRGRFGFRNNSQHYGSEIALVAQLEVTYEDGSLETFVTDTSWKTSQGEVRFSSLYDGTTIDFNHRQEGWKLTGFDDSEWSEALAKDGNTGTLKPRISSPVRVVGEFPLTLEPIADRVLLRGVQNVSGWVRLTVNGRKGQSVTVRHAEVLEDNIRLHTKALRTAKATDTYILSRDGIQVLEPRFTFHGFQHADVVTEAKVVSATAVAISSDNRSRGRLITSHEGLNQLHNNVVWSQLDNFVSVPTDCPQRDERLGWTGDAQAFAATANTLQDASSFWASWLIDLELDQAENGDVGAVVPDILKLDKNLVIGEWILEGRAGWADAATIVPMSVYEYFGDKAILRQQLGSMRRWTDALNSRRGEGMFLPSEFQFGDWCDPDAPGDRPWEAKVSADFVANSFFAHTAHLMAMAEHIVGSPERAATYEEMSSRLKSDIWVHLAPEALETTAGCAIAIEFGIAPASELKAVAKKLAAMVADDKGKITTGFLATPLILHALSKNNHTDAAYTMLLRRDFRSWLYAVDRGATTIWERWDAIQEDGSLHAGAMDTNPEGQDDASMISFNHYAYGAVIDWVYRNVGGLAPEVEQPGYQRVTVMPKPVEGINFAEVAIASDFGSIELSWRIDDSQRLVAKLAVPFGVTAKLDLPVTAASTVTCDGQPTSSNDELGYGSYLLVVTNPRVARA